MWTETDDGRLLCEPHGESFPKGRSCPSCESDPIAPPDEEAAAPIPAPEGCLSLADLEAEAVDLARQAERKMVTKDVANGPWVDFANVRLKALRFAAELARTREDEEIVRRRDALWQSTREASH